MLNTVKERSAGPHRISAHRADDDALAATNIPFVAQVFRLHARIILACTFVALVSGGIYFYLATPTYVAAASVLIDYKRLAPLDEDLSLANGRIDAAAIQSQVSLITSRAVLRTAVEKLHLDRDPEFVGSNSLALRLLAGLGLATNPATLPRNERIETAITELSRHLSVDRKDVSYVIFVEVETNDAGKAARIANAIADSYIGDQLAAKTEAASRATDWLQHRIGALHEDVSNAQRASVKYRLDNSIMLADGKYMDETQVSEISTQLTQARVDRETALAKVGRIDEIIKSGKLDGGVFDEFSNPVIVQLRNNYLKNLRLIDEYATRYGRDHQAVVRLRNEAARLQTSIFDEFKRIAQGYRSDAAVAEARETSLAAELKTLSQRSNASQDARITSNQLDARAASVAAIRDAFLSKNVEAFQKQSFPITEARVVSRATPPLQPAAPRPFRSIAGGAMIGLLGGFVIGAWREAFSRRLKTQRQLQLASGVRCFGLLQKLEPGQTAPANGKSGAVRHSELSYAARAPFSMFAEVMRGIKVSIDAEDSYGTPGKVIGIVSSLPGEGKSLVAANFAYGCAASGMPTLLIDADLRRAGLTLKLAPTIKVGAAQLIRGETRLAEVIRATQSHYLHFVPAGSAEAPDFASAIHAMARSPLADARRHYRYVVVDLPPLIPVPDARAIAPLIDHFILVTEWNATTWREMSDALAGNGAVAEKLLGAVFNKVDLRVMEQLREPGLATSHYYYSNAVQRA